LATQPNSPIMHFHAILPAKIDFSRQTDPDSSAWHFLKNWVAGYHPSQIRVADPRKWSIPKIQKWSTSASSFGRETRNHGLGSAKPLAGCQADRLVAHPSMAGRARVLVACRSNLGRFFKELQTPSLGSISCEKSILTVKIGF